MRSLHLVAVVARKELIDAFRDRRAMLVTFISAILAGPLMLFLILNMVANQAEKTRELKLPVVGAEHSPALIEFLKRQRVAILPVDPAFDKAIIAGDLDIVLEIDASFPADAAAGKAATVRLYYDRSRDRARASINQVEALLDAYGRQWGQSRLLLRGIALQVAHPLKIEDVDYATPQQSGSAILFLVAYYGLFTTLMGGLAAALDSTAGERERASLEPLLTTPISPIQLALGKWLAIAMLDGAVVALTLLGFYLTLRFAPLPAVGIPFLFGSRELYTFVLILMPLMLLFPAILLAMGFRGRSFKEAQANVSIVLFLVSLLPVIQIFAQRKEPEWLLWVPVSAQYSLLNRALRGDSISALAWAQSYVVPLLISVLAMLAVARMLSRESLLASK